MDNLFSGSLIRVNTLEDMPKCETKFNDCWLDETDGNVHKLRLRCSKGKSDTAAYCFLCKKTIQCGNAGFAQVLQHSEKNNTHSSCKDSMQWQSDKIAFKVVLWWKNHFLFFFRFWKRIRLTTNWQNFELCVLSEGCLFWV